MRTGTRSRKFKSPFFTLFLEDLLDEVVDLFLVGELLGSLGLGGVGPDDESEAAVYLGVVEGARAQEAVGQGAEEGYFAVYAGAVG